MGTTHRDKEAAQFPHRRRYWGDATELSPKRLF
jgi:hypothetical protein